MNSISHLTSARIISKQEAQKLISSWPPNVSFSETFAKLHELRHHFQAGYILAEYTQGALLLPVQWGDGSAFSVHKGHTAPYVVRGSVLEPEWKNLGAHVLRITKSHLYIADLAVSADKAQDLKALPSAAFTLDISGLTIETLFTDTFNKTTRNLIRRSQEQGFRVEILKGTMPDEYYQLYSRHQQNLGTPPRAKEYFDQVASVFGEGYVIIGVYDGEKLAGMNLSWVAEKGLWLSINSSLPEYGPRHVNYLLYYETIRWACENGIDRIDFGGSPTHDGNMHNAFKLGFGATMTSLYRLRVGTLSALLADFVARKKRAVHIRFNKLLNK